MRRQRSGKIRREESDSTGYQLSKKEDRVGSPEKPLSGLGEVTYKTYWKLTVFRYLRDAEGEVSMDGERFYI